MEHFPYSGDKDGFNLVQKLQTKPRCHICGKCYERVDHLNRHLNSHGNARSFRCNFCPRAFNRSDLLLRHVVIHSRVDSNDGKAKLSDQSKRRAVQACSHCTVSKAKCDNQKPCQRCKAKNLSCKIVPLKWHQKSQIQRPKNAQTEGAPVDLDMYKFVSQLDSCNTVESNRVGMSDTSPPFSSPPNSMPPKIGTSSQTSMTNENPKPSLSEAQPGHDAHTFPGLHLYEDHSDQTEQWVHEQDLSAYQISNRLVFDIWTLDCNIDFDFGDLDHQIFDPSFVDQQLGPVTYSEAGQENSERSQNRVGLRHQAFQKSPWLWSPMQIDYLHAVQGDLMNKNTELRFEALNSMSQPYVIDHSLNETARDRIFAMVLEFEQLKPPLSSFPPAKFLDYLMQKLFLAEAFKFDTYLHPGSLRPSDVPPELLGAIIAAGATYIATPEIWKMGLALQEVVRSSSKKRV